MQQGSFRNKVVYAVLFTEPCLACAWWQRGINLLAEGILFCTDA